MSTPFSVTAATLTEVRPLFERHHGYGSVGAAATYVFAVRESGGIVAAFVWQPPAPGAARSVCSELPAAVLSLSRMVAVPSTERELRHKSKPLRRQMKRLIDRSRWPVLVTYSDEGQGHTGHVYKCSGWQATLKARRAFYVGDDGRRLSPYSNGRHRAGSLTRGGTTTLQRWEKWACEPGDVAAHLAAGGWERVKCPGKRWKSGAQAYRWRKAL